MSTSTTLKIPHELVETLRDGLHAELADAAAGVVEASQTPEPRRDYRPALAQFDAARRLLEEIGWSSLDGAESVEVDVALHHEALLAALSAEIRSHEDLLEEADAVDTWRARLGKPSIREETHARAAALRGLALDVETRLGSGARERGEAG